jgi:hypothetical protein
MVSQLFENSNSAPTFEAAALSKSKSAEMCRKFIF